MCKQIYIYEKKQGVCHCGIDFYIKKYLKAKEDL